MRKISAIRPIAFAPNLSTSSAGNQKQANRPPLRTLRASLINALGDLNDPEIIAGCRERFEKYLD